MHSENMVVHSLYNYKKLTWLTSDCCRDYFVTISLCKDTVPTKLIFSFTRFAEGPDFDRFHARCYFLVVVGIILPSMPRFYSCPLGSCRRSPASCCCAGA